LASGVTATLGVVGVAADIGGENACSDPPEVGLEELAGEAIEGAGSLLEDDAGLVELLLSGGQIGGGKGLGKKTVDGNLGVCDSSVKRGRQQDGQ